jgi:hypothetical protein
MSATVTRRTSVYTIRLTDHTDEDARRLLDDVRKSLAWQGVGVADHGDRSISYRAAGDEAAAQIARDALAGLSDPWDLTTGLGVHRRTVEHHAGDLAED